MMDKRNIEMMEISDEELECVTGGKRDEQTNILVTLLRLLGVDC